MAGGYTIDAADKTYITVPDGATIAGFSGGTPGQHLIVYNRGGANTTFYHESTADAENQITSFTAADFDIAAGKFVYFVYDGTLLKWLAIGNTDGT